MSDIPSQADNPQETTPLTGASEKLSPAGQRNMQGDAETPALEPVKVADQSFVDNKGHDINIRAYPAGDLCMIRAYDQARTPNLPESATYSDVGMANVTLEKDPDGKVQKARLNDIEVPTEEYEKAGIGSQLLETAEGFSKNSGAKELYGNFSPKTGQEAFLKDWYEKRGYQFRDGALGQEVFKSFETPASPAGNSSQPLKGI